jgi:peptidoglycan hydrolase-like protein with peptidoglycan-binding domain
MVVDNNTTLTVVDDTEAAWCILSGNAHTLNVCFAGSFAAWTRDQWLANDGMLRQAAQVIADWGHAYNIPLNRRLPSSEVLTGQGIIDHHDWTIGANDGTHTDCGPNFPWDIFLGYVNGSAPVAQAAPAAAPAPVDVPAAAQGNFPLSGGQYFGPLSGPAESISGQAGNDANMQPYIKQCQQRLIDLGYGRFFPTYGADGMYGTDTQSSELGQATIQFQKDHPPLSVDGGIGRETWDAFFAQAAPAGPVADHSAATPNPNAPAAGPGESGSGTPVQRGNTGFGVREVQDALNRAGFNCGPVDGLFGPSTDDALRHFQQAHGLVADGVAGSSTRSALVAADQPTPAPAPTPQDRPTFPLSGSQYFGPLSGPADSISGQAGNDSNMQPYIRQCQQRLIDLGYGRFFPTYGADGMYGQDVQSSELGQATMQFQRDHPPLSVDGGIGQETWNAFFA